MLRLVQNPTVDDPPNAGLSNKADYKGGQKKQFGNYRWISCQDPSLLDAERCEFILIGATEDLQGKAHKLAIDMFCLFFVCLLSFLVALAFMAVQRTLLGMPYSVLHRP